MTSQPPWSEALFRALTQHSGDIVSLLDAQGRLLYNSPAAQRISGFSAEELAGADTFQLMHPDDRPAVAEAFGRALATPGATITVQYRYARKAGGWTWMEAVASNQLDNPEVRGVVATSRDISERKAAEDALRRGEARLRALAARMEALREEEQARIARDLHDDLSQLLTGLTYEFRRAEDRLAASEAPPWIEDWLVDTRELVTQAHEAVRRIAFGLRPPMLDALGLPQALEQEGRRFEERTGIRCAVGAGPLPELPLAATTALFRIAQEALTNVARHAGATGVQVRLRADGGAVELSVADDGRGPPPEEAPSAGFGLLGIRERAARLGGVARLERGAAGGAVLVARLPLEAGPR